MFKAILEVIFGLFSRKWKLKRQRRIFFKRFYIALWTKIWSAEFKREQFRTARESQRLEYDRCRENLEIVIEKVKTLNEVKEPTKDQVDKTKALKKDEEIYQSQIQKLKNQLDQFDNAIEGVQDPKTGVLTGLTPDIDQNRANMALLEEYRKHL
jgi:chromosome segregation ATPase